MSEWHECHFCGRRWIGGSSKLPVCEEHKDALLRRAYLWLTQNTQDSTLVEHLRTAVSEEVSQ